MTRRKLGHYEILDKLGEGGMGVVWKARDTRLDRLVALKVLPADKVANTERERRFVQEARAASALNHPNIITVHDISSDDGATFMVMEYLPGKTLDQLIPRTGLRTADTLKYAIQIADALAAAHAAGIVHRDVKPGNIMVAEDGRVKVLDFGLAKLTEASGQGEDDATVTIRPDTAEGTILGTVSYMSPEQAEGKKVDARSDIFAFGAVLYEMITGQRAFLGDSKMSTLAAILNKEPKPVSEAAKDVPRDLEKIVVRCLRKDRDRRIQHAADLKVALLDLKEESDSGSSGSGIAPPPARAKRRWLIPVLAAAVLLAAAGLFRMTRPQPDRAAPEMHSVVLTSYTGQQRDPALSPDGRQVAFSWNGEKGGNYDIYVKLADAGTPVRLTQDPAPGRFPAWSPDGRFLAFVRLSREGKGGYYTIPALGGAERKIADIPQAPSHRPAPSVDWTPDSKSLVIVDTSVDPPALAQVSVADGDKKRLTTPPANSFGDYLPAVSPDGRWLAFTSPRWQCGTGSLSP